MHRLAAAVALSLLASACQKQDAPSGETAETATASSAQASGDPGDMKPGLWEVVVVSDGEEPETTRQCIMPDEAEIKEFEEMLNGPAKAGCTKTRDVGANGVTVRISCPNEAVNQVELNLKGSDVRREMTLKMTANGEAMSDMKMTSRWLGACPTGSGDGDSAEG